VNAVRRFLAARLDRNSYLGLHLTVGLAAAALALWLFGAVLEEVLDDEAVVRWDVAVLGWAREHRTSGGIRTFFALTQLGDPLLITAIAVVGGIAILRQRQWSLLIAWIAVFAGGGMLNRVVKAAVARARPEYAAEYLRSHSFSFPSGHVMGAMIGYGMLAYVVASHWRPPHFRPGQVYTFAALVILVVAVSRIYLGVHFPTDVIGGVAAGAGWLLICLSGLHVARHRSSATPRSDRL
jgi:membrane-associated phospholipid phosphatase